MRPRKKPRDTSLEEKRRILAEIDSEVLVTRFLSPCNCILFFFRHGILPLKCNNENHEFEFSAGCRQYRLIIIVFIKYFRHLILLVGIIILIEFLS